MQQTDIEVDRAARGAGVSRRKAHAALLTFYILAAVLNGGALQREAELLPYGRGRDLAIRLARPFAWSARVTGLDRLRTVAEALAPPH